ncbi:hypothetical protein ASA1KI_11940 [Opitutales bacterium ASA1]|nr:hypothetical protein ASA1KI_11940 [Opitutales bacterium ASA1]
MTAVVFACLCPLAGAQETERAEAILELSPFEVESTRDNGYAATSSLAGSRLNTDLRDIAAAVQAVTPEFMQDIGATNLQKLLLYTTNTEVAGIDGNYYGGDAWDKGYSRGLLVEPQKSTRIRGLNTADITRDFFPTDVPVDWYNLSRVDISRGPNAMLFGLGSPAGLINNTLKVPVLGKTAYTAEVKVDNYGSHREMIDVDHTIIPGRLGVRVVGLNDEARFRQDFTFNDDRRLYAALRYQPKLGRGIFTQFDANGEWTKIRANRPVAGTPADFLSNWYGPAGRILVANDEYWANPPQFGQIENIYASQTLGGQLWDDHPVSFFSDATSGAVGLPGGGPQAMLARGWSNVNGGGWGSWVGLLNPNWEINNPGHEKNSPAYYASNPIVSGIISDFEAQTGRTFRGFGQGMWPAQMIVDGPIARLMAEQNLIGPNKREFNDFETFNLGVTQSYLDGRVGWNFAYNEQRYRSGYTNHMEGLWGNNVVSIDINQTLRNSTTPNNPNVGRIYTFGEGRGGIYEKRRENWRFTAFAKVEAEDLLKNDGWLARTLGEHTFTGVASSQRYENFDRSFALYRWGSEYGEALGWNNPGYATWRGIHYLSDSVLNTNSMDELTGVTGVRTIHAPALNQTVLAVARNDANQYVWGQNTYDLLSWQSNLDRLYDGASQGYDTTESKILIWQGRMLGGVLVPIFGWREDEYERWNKRSALARDPTYNFVLPYSSAWNYDGVTPVYAKEQRRSWSLAVHGRELMRLLGRSMPDGMDVSLLYNDSSSFRPSDVAVDVYNRQEANPSGETRDVSLLVSGFENRVSLRVTKYKTVQKNTPFIGATPPFNRNKSVLGRSMNGMMWEIAPQWGTTPAEDRHQPTPEWLVNKWMFGENNYDKAIEQQPLPANWRDIPGILTQPLRIRHSAVPGDPTYIAQGAINPDLGIPYVAPPLSEDEIAYRAEWFRARTQAEWSRPVDQDWWNAVGFEPNWSNPWGGPWEVTAWQVPPNSRSLNDLESKGIEYEITANPTANWRISFNASKAEAVRSNVLNSWDEYVEENIPFWFDGGYGLNDAPAMDYWSFRGFYDIPESPGSTLGTGGRLGTGYGSEILGPYYQAKATEERMVNELRKWHFNFVSNYAFTTGRLKGLGIGGAYRWMDKSTIGYYPKYNADANAWVNDLDKPIEGPSEDYLDVWISYQRPLGDKITWSAQLNVYNVFSDDRMIPIQANPDGSLAQVRIPGETTWSFTNTFKF